MRNKVGRGKQESALGKLRAGRRRTKCLPVCWILGCCQLNHLGSSLAPGYPELQRRASRRRSGYRRASSTPFCRTRPLFLDLEDSGQEWKVHRKPSTSSSGSPAFSRTKANHRNSQLQTRGLGHESTPSKLEMARCFVEMGAHAVFQIQGKTHTRRMEQ